MRDRFGITIAGGQGRLKGRIARIAHCGYFGAFDIVVTIAAFEMTLRELGHELELGAGVAAAQRVFLEAGVPVSQPADADVKVLVKEKIGDSGVAAAARRRLRRRARRRLGRRRARAPHRRVRRHPDPLRHAADRRPARARRTGSRRSAGPGVGVDNVDVDAATKRGVVVANAPQSNVITAAEHTLAMLLALARKVPQAHGSLTGGAWERSSFSGVELYEKTLGVLGFGRIGQLVAQRALGFGMRVLGLRRLRGRGALPRARRRARRQLRRAVRPGRLHHDPPARHARDRELARRRGLREDEGRRAHRQRRARQAARRRRPARRARLRQGGRRRARRLPRGAGDRAPAVRLSQRGRHAAPRAPPPPRPPTAPATRPPSRWWRR